MVAIASTSTSYTTIFGTGNNWVEDARVSILEDEQAGGLIGMLRNAKDGYSIKSFLERSAKSANALATINQSNAESAGSLYAKMASENLKKRNDEALQKAMDELAKQQQMVPVQDVLDPIIYFSDGSTIDTRNNIMTRVDGTQYDTITGAKYVDPASIIQIANGSYLDTKNNILTMADGTQIDTVTGLKISVTA